MPLTIIIALVMMLVAGVILAMGTLPYWKKYVDKDGDGDIDVKDVKVIADLNKDGKVDEVDLNIAKTELKKAAKAVNAVVGAVKK